MATATATRTRRARRVVRKAAAAAPSRRTVRQTARAGSKMGIATLATLGVIIALGATALVIAAVDPRAEEYLRRGAREAGNAARGWASRLPEHLPDRHALEHVGHQIAETGQRLASLVRAQG